MNSSVLYICKATGNSLEILRNCFQHKKQIKSININKVTPLVCQFGNGTIWMQRILFDELIQLLNIDASGTNI